MDFKSHFHSKKDDIVAGILIVLLCAGIASAGGAKFLESGTYGFASELNSKFGIDKALLSQALLVLPPIALALCGLVIYLALRASGTGLMPSFFGAAIFAVSPLVSALHSLGVYGWPQASLLLAALGLCCIYFGGAVWAVGALLFLLSSAAYSPASFVAIAIGAAMLCEEFYFQKDEKKRAIAPGAALLLVGIVGFGFNGFAVPQAGDILAGLGEARFVFPLAAFTLAGAGRKFSEKGDMLNFIMIALAVPVAAFFPAGAVLMLAFVAGKGAEEMLRLHMKTRDEKLIAYFSAAFLLALLFLDFPASPMPTAVIAITFAAAVVVVLYMYEFKGELIPLIILILLLAGAAVASAYAIQSGSVLSQAVKTQAFSFESAPAIDSFAWFEMNAPQGAVVAYFGDSKALEFISGRKAFNDRAALAKFLAGTSSASLLKASGADYLVIENSLFDDPAALENASGLPFYVESYGFFANATFDQGSYAVFRSSRNELLFRPVDETGELAFADSELLDSQMRFLAKVRFSELRMLDGSAPYYSDENRVLRPMNSYSSNAVRLFFENVSGMEEVHREPGARVFRIK